MRAHLPGRSQSPLIKESAAFAPRAKLTIGAEGDGYEQEADRVAEQVMQPRPASAQIGPPAWSLAIARSTQVQRKCVGCEEDEKVRGKPIGSALALSPSVAEGIGATRGGGAPLPAATRTFFEPRFGCDFSGVRVHDDAHAHAMSAELRARAFTIGSDVYFGAGGFAPESSAGGRLLAHELAHTVQQRGAARPSVIQRQAGGCARPGETVDEARDELALAGRLAHAQIQGVFSGALDSEVSIPRATKVMRGAPCPPSGTAVGRADFFRFSGGLGEAQVGEIKSVHGARFAAPDVQHYNQRLGELGARIAGAPCGSAVVPADAADTAFDRAWLRGQLGRGQAPPFTPLDGVVPPSPTDMGPFAGDPLNKELFCERRAGGAVIYWCRRRNLDEDEQQRERQRLRIPANEDVRRTQPQPGARQPTIIDVQPDFREPLRQMPRPAMPNGRDFVVVASEPMFSSVVDARRMLDQLRRMRIDLRSNPVFQFRQLTWTTAAVVMAAGVTAAVLAAIGAAAIPTAAGVAVGGAAAAGGGAVVIPLFGAGSTVAVTEVLKAAAAVIIVSSVALHSGDAQAAGDVDRALGQTPVFLQLDATDDARAVGGGPSLPGAASVGARWTVDGQPYRVIAVTTTT